jgi:septal ring factor EnvC (AmiA/AmiB activator)
MSTASDKAEAKAAAADDAADAKEVADQAKADKAAEPTPEEKIWLSIDKIRNASPSHPGLTWPVIADALEAIYGKPRPAPREVKSEVKKS